MAVCCCLPAAVNCFALRVVRCVLLVVSSLLGVARSAVLAVCC